jgi:4a-hydroxytetrahydrobiopterin dehydratase
LNSKITEKALPLLAKWRCYLRKKNHHPQIILDYGTVTISLISHDVQKVTQRDLDLAEQIDKLYQE